MKLLTRAFAAVLVAWVSAPAHANKSAYVLTIVNKTPMRATVNFNYSGCFDWVGNGPTFPFVVEPYTSSIQYTFYRASRCSGENGQLALSITEGWGAAPGGGLLALVMDYDADGGMNVTMTGGWNDGAASYAFASYVTPDSSTITFTLVNKNQVDLATALQSDCWAPQDAENKVASLPEYSDVGSVSTAVAKQYATSSYVTKLLVTQPMWGFRAPTFSRNEEGAMRNGTLLSKMANYLATRDSDGRAAAWSLWGPPIEGGAGPVTLPLRLLAIGSSDVPRSQLVSVALDYATAARYGTVGNYVYAFQITPDSEILGLRTCGTVTGGEIQVQPLGGTPIWNLMRSSNGIAWTAWNGSAWVPSAIVPSNGALP
jgi:hypothetical protein